MLAREIYEFRSQLQAQKVLIAYSGYVSEGIVHALGDALKQKLAMDETDRSLTKRVFSVFIEQVQNIIRYSDEAEDGGGVAAPLRSGVVTVGVEDGRFFVLCANIVDAAKAPRLRERLETLAAMDQDALRTYYRQKLRDESEAESHGGTIGLIEIARRASAPIQFDFLELDARTTFFCLKAFI